MSWFQDKFLTVFLLNVNQEPFFIDGGFFCKLIFVLQEANVKEGVLKDGEVVESNPVVRKRGRPRKLVTDTPSGVSEDVSVQVFFLVRVEKCCMLEAIVH